VILGGQAILGGSTVEAQPAPPGSPLASGASASVALEQVVRTAESQGFAGTVLVATADSIVYVRAVGVADHASARAHTLDVPWRWASVTKQVTAVLVLQQVEAGRLRLDQSVADVLPEFRGPTARQVTVRQLLQHTSGLPDPNGTPAGPDGVPAFYRPAATQPAVSGIARARDTQRYAARNRRESADRDAALGFCAGAAARPPGDRFAYNNCDYLVLGAVLERVTGLSYAALVERQLAGPLGLASLRVLPRGATAPTPVVGYLASGAPEPAFDIGTYGAAGALHGTADDLLAFDRALLGGRLLTPASRIALWAGDPKLGYAALGAWVFPATIEGCAAPVRLVERRGAIGGIQVRNVLVIERGVSVIVFTNREAVDFGEVWQRQGLTYALLRATLCS
jgi:CubicO group peptidase (beta-lactamase class C family)